MRYNLKKKKKKKKPFQNDWALIGLLITKERVRYKINFITKHQFCQNTCTKVLFSVGKLLFHPS